MASNSELRHCHARLQYVLMVLAKSRCSGALETRRADLMWELVFEIEPETVYLPPATEVEAVLFGKFIRMYKHEARFNYRFL